MDHSKWQKIIKDHGLRGSVGHALTVTGLISGTGQNVTPTLLYICKCVHRASVKVGEILVFLGGEQLLYRSLPVPLSQTAT